MKYNIYLKTQLQTENIFDISDENLSAFLKNYNSGIETVMIRGKKYWLNDIFEIQIFTFEHEKINTEKHLIEICNRNGFFEKNMIGIKYIPTENLEKFGKNVTEKFIKGGFGDFAEQEDMEQTDLYVAVERIKEIEQIKSSTLDFTKLIAMLKELNKAYQNKMLLTIPLIVRAIIDHVPPIFNKENFTSVTGSYGSRSFKDNMIHLDKSCRKIADGNIHQPIRIKENLPNITQVNYKNDLDVLLQEIVRINK